LRAESFEITQKDEIKKRKKQIQEEKTGFTYRKEGRICNAGFSAAHFGQFPTGYICPFFDRR